MKILSRTTDSDRLVELLQSLKWNKAVSQLRSEQAEQQQDLFAGNYQPAEKVKSG